MSLSIITEEQAYHIITICRKHVGKPIGMLMELSICSEVDAYLKSEYDQCKTEILFRCKIREGRLYLDGEGFYRASIEILKFIA